MQLNIHIYYGSEGKCKQRGQKEEWEFQAAGWSSRGSGVSRGGSDQRPVTGYHGAAPGYVLCLTRDRRGLGGVLAPDDLQTANRPELSLCGLCPLPLGVVALSLLLVLFSSELHYFVWYF